MLNRVISFHSGIVMIITAIVFAGVYNHIFDEKLDLNGDNANYYILGKALATGEGYVNLNNIHKSPHTHFAPGYPTIISGFIAVFGESTTTIKIVNGLFLFLTLIILYFLVKRISTKESTAIIVIVLVMFNSHILRYSTIIMTEIPFLFFSTFALLSLIKINYIKPFWQDINLYLAIIMLAISFYIRTSGLALVIGVLIYLFLTGQRKHMLVIGIGVLLLVLPWQLRNHNIGGNTYVKQLSMINPYRPELGKAGFRDYYSRVGNNVKRYLTKEIPAATLSITKPNYRQTATVSQWLYGATFFMIIIFGVLNLKNYKLLIISYLASTLTLLLLWPDVWVGIRFLLPAVPFLIIGLVNGLQELLVRIVPLVAVRYILWLPLLIIILLFPGIIKLRGIAKTNVRPEWVNYYSLASWARENLATKSVIACRKPALFYLYSKSFTVNYKFTEDAKAFLSDLHTKQVNYLVMEQLGYASTSRYLYPVIQNNSDHFELVQERNRPDTYLFRLK